MSAYPCPACSAPTQYRAFSGGREFQCTECDMDGYYPDDAAGLPRAALLCTEDGRTRLRAEMDQELARRREESP